jgi:hypothetical protein
MIVDPLVSRAQPIFSVVRVPNEGMLYTAFMAFAYSGFCLLNCEHIKNILVPNLLLSTAVGLGRSLAGPQSALGHADHICNMARSNLQGSGPATPSIGNSMVLGTARWQLSILC